MPNKENGELTSGELASLEKHFSTDELQSVKPNGYDDQGWCGEND